MGHESYAKNLLISNCHLVSTNGFNSVYNFDLTSTILVDHCVMKVTTSSAARYTNNIIINDSSLPTGAYGSNNIFITGGTSSAEADDDGNWYHMNKKDVWADENESGNYAENKTFELKDPIRYIGNDFTQIGLHGGIYAWNKIPVIPRITECIMDTENVNNGTLKVSIKAEAQTKE